jgi:hypothetical protein
MGIRNPTLYNLNLKTATARSDGNRSAAVFSFLPPRVLLVMLLAAGLAIPRAANGKDHLTYGEGLIVNIPLPASEVSLVVEDVAQNGIIRGTKEYNKDEFVSGAKAASTSEVFPEWDQGGKVFYKVRTQVLDPRNFKDSGDIGTLVVRYVVMPQGEKNTVLRIDALFKEDFRHSVHQSNGSVESAEYKDIEEHIEAIEVMKQQNSEAQKERQEVIAKKQNPGMWGETESRGESSSRTPSEPSFQSVPAQSVPATPIQDPPNAAVNSATPVAPAESPEPASVSLQPGQTLEQHVEDLRKQVERLVKAPGAALKSAPFHTASTMQSLSAGTEVLILISTPYWYGVETHDGQHGWLMRDQLEQR